MGMSGSTKTVGGGSNKGTADAFNQFLLGQISNGTLSGMFGSGQQGQNNGFNPLTYGQQNFDTSGAGQNNPMFGALQSQLDRQTQMGIADMRTRFGAAGGAPRGSNAAMAEGNFLANANPANMLAMGQLGNSFRDQSRADLGMAQGDLMQRMGMNMQQSQFGQGMDMQKLQMLMQGMMQSNQIGSPQAQTVQTPSGFGQAMGAVAGIAPWALAPFTGGASLGLSGMFGGGGANNPMGGMTMNSPAPWTPPQPNWSYPGGR